MTELHAGPRITYDAAVDALAIELIADGRHARTLRVGSGDILAHFDGKNRLVELELLHARRLYSAAELATLASPAEWLTLKEAAAIAGLAPATLRWQIRNKRLAAVKRGPDWLVSRAALGNYLEDRKPAGRPAASVEGRALRGERKRVSETRRS